MAAGLEILPSLITLLLSALAAGRLVSIFVELRIKSSALGHSSSPNVGDGDGSNTTTSAAAGGTGLVGLGFGAFACSLKELIGFPNPGFGGAS
jgi:hypothetical protein